MCKSPSDIWIRCWAKQTQKKDDPWRGWYFPAVLRHQALPVEESYDRSPEPTGEDRRKRLPGGLYFSQFVSPMFAFPNVHPRNLTVHTLQNDGYDGKGRWGNPFGSKPIFRGELSNFWGVDVLRFCRFGGWKKRSPEAKLVFYYCSLGKWRINNCKKTWKESVISIWNVCIFLKICFERQACRMWLQSSLFRLSWLHPFHESQVLASWGMGNSHPSLFSRNPPLFCRRISDKKNFESSTECR